MIIIIAIHTAPIIKIQMAACAWITKNLTLSYSHLFPVSRCLYPSRLVGFMQPYRGT